MSIGSASASSTNLGVIDFGEQVQMFCNFLSNENYLHGIYIKYYNQSRGELKNTEGNT